MDTYIHHIDKEVIEHSEFGETVLYLLFTILEQVILFVPCFYVGYLV